MVRRLFGQDRFEKHGTPHITSRGRNKAMQVRVSGKQIEIGEALSQHVRSALEASVSKLFGRGAEASVVFSHEGPFYRADCKLHLDSGVMLQTQGENDDVHKAFDLALEHMEKRMRRHMRRLKDQHNDKPSKA